MTTEVQWNDLARDPRSVARLADTGDVLVRRRDGSDFILQRADRAQTASKGAQLAARALRSILGHMTPRDSANILREEFPWIDVFDANGIEQFRADFLRAVQTSADLGRWSPLERTLQRWIDTASILNDPELTKELSTPIDGDFGPVKIPDRPAGAEA